MMTMNFFYYSIQTKELKNESNLIESFELPRILNSIKFLNYLIQTHSKSHTCILLWVLLTSAPEA
jgi:hypothetical protein